MQNQMKRSIKKTIRPGIFIKTVNVCLVIATIAVLMFEINVLTSAQDAQPAAPAAAPAPQVESADKTNRCVEHMQAFMATKRIELGDFMNTHFRSAKPTSELIAAAIEKFKQYRKEVRTEMANRGTAKVTVSSAANEQAECEAAIQEEFNLIKAMISGHITQNAYAKKSTRLIDKYKVINGKLEKLNATVGQMYGYFGALSQQLPCYATNCVK